MFKATKADMTLTLDGEPLSPHREVDEAFESIIRHGYGDYEIKRPSVFVSYWPDEVEPEEPDPVDPEEPIEEPPVDPDPVEPTLPVPIDHSKRPADITRHINRNTRINFDYFNSTDYERYVRGMKTIVWRDDAVKVRFKRQDDSGALQPLDEASYTLTANGATIATIELQPGAKFGIFTVDVTKIPDGDYVLDIPTNGTETTVPYPITVLRGPLFERNWMASFSSSQGLPRTGYIFTLRWVPTRFAQTLPPLPKREYPDFDNLNGPFFIENLTGTLSEQVRRAYITKDGVMSTTSVQGYTVGHMEAKNSVMPLLDGPRGVGSIVYPTHIRVGSARVEDKPDSPLIGNSYICQPWRVSSYSPIGYIKTLIGWRSKGIPSISQDPQNYELVGNWDAVPEGRRSLWGCWGMDFGPVTVDHNADPIESEGGRQPHNDIEMFVTSPGFDCVLKAVFDGKDHRTPAVVSEFSWGKDSWDCRVWVDPRTNKTYLFVSERELHRVAKYDALTGNLAGVEMQGEALGYVAPDRYLHRTGTIEAIRAQECVLPEGLDIVDNWLYMASAAMAQIRRKDLITGKTEIVYSPPSPPLDLFWKIAVSKGDAGPKYTVYKTNWSNDKFGAPLVINPDGTIGRKLIFGHEANVARGVATGYCTTGYSGAVGAGHGRIEWGGSSDGVRRLSLALPSDKVIDTAKYARGRKEWFAKGRDKRYGDYAESFFGEPVPYGESVDQDYFLDVNRSAV